MTLIVAVACTDGVVLCADSASTDSESGYKQPAVKIRRVGEHPILYGGSGDVGLLQKIDENVQTYSSQGSLKRVRQEVKRLVVPEQQEAIRLHAQYPIQGFHLPPPAILLFAGVLDRKPWILEVEKNGGDTLYGIDMGGFAAIGSGKASAQALFRPHLTTERGLRLGKILAYRVMDDSIELAAQGLARPIRMYALDLDGHLAELDADEERGLQTSCELWRSLEREAVGQLLSPTKELAPQVPTVE